MAIPGDWTLFYDFDNLDTPYSGNLASQSITGISTTFGGLDGCFYLLQAGVPTTFAAERAAGKVDSGGQSQMGVGTKRCWLAEVDRPQCR